MNDNRTPTASDRLLAIVRQLARETHPAQSYAVSSRTSFEHDLGLDSLARVELMQRVGREFGVELPPAALAEADTPGELLRFLGAAPGAGVAVAAVLPGGSAGGVPDAARTLPEVLEWHVARQPDRVHILLHDEQHHEQALSYRGLLEAALAVAAGLAAGGVRPGQTVALMLPTGMDYVATFFGAMIVGAVPVPIYPPARIAGIEDHLRRHVGILANAGAALMVTVDAGKTVGVMLQAALPSLGAIVTPAELRAQAHGAPPPHRPGSGDIAFIQYTSGSTGAPKGVVLTHANLLANIRALVKAAQAGPDDRFVSWLPLYHDMGLIGAWFGSLYGGLPLVLMSPLAFLARPALWLETISRHRGTISAAPNFAYELCVRHVGGELLAGLDLSSWRLALNGAEPVSAATLRAFADRFAPCGLRRAALTPVYGLAESSVGLAFPPPGRGPRIDVLLREPFAREGKAIPAPAGAAGTIEMVCCGYALPGHELRIVDDAGIELPERRVGRLEFRGPSATAGYYRNPDATRALLRDGWLDSGDYAYMAQGEVFLAGRVKDLIKRGGRNLYPYDLEDAIGKVPGIRKGCVAVFGSPDPATGTERLVVVAETGERARAARAALRLALNQIAVDVIGTPPDDIVLVPPHTVLKTSSGKIRRVASRQAYEQGTLARPLAWPWLQRARFAVGALRAKARIGARRAVAWCYGAWAWAVFGMLLLPFGSLVIVLQWPAGGRRLARLGSRLLLRLAGSMPCVSGIERLPREPHVLLVNHGSYLDSFVLSALLPATPGYVFAAKREFARGFWMRGLLGGLGAIFVERGDARRSAGDVAALAAGLRKGKNVVVFPEGTFAREAGIRPFHAGAFAAAAQAGAPVVVAGLRGTRAILREGTWWPRRMPIGFEIGPVLAPPGTDWTSIVRLRDEARGAMARLSGEFALPG